MGQLKDTLFWFAALVAVVVIIFVGVNQSNKDNRDVAASYGYGDEKEDAATGHTYYEEEMLWHLSEGADVFPLRWFLNLETVIQRPWYSNDTFLYQDLENKFGLRETNIVRDSYYNDYYAAEPTYSGEEWVSPMKWVGLTLAWSEPSSFFGQSNDITIKYGEKPKTDNEANEALFKIDQQGLRALSSQAAKKLNGMGVTNSNGTFNSKFKGQVEIPMMGTNCAFCHSGSVEFLDSKRTYSFVEGAPNMINTRNFFQDISGAALATMLDEGKLKKFVMRLQNKGLLGMKARKVNVPRGNQPGFHKVEMSVEQQAEALAKSFSTGFKKKLKGVPEGLIDTESIMAIWYGAKEGKKAVVQRALDKPENKGQLAKHFAKLMALSYGMFRYDENVIAPIVDVSLINATPSLKKRSEWLEYLMTTPLDLAVTTEGYNRTDAFGRISNWVARRHSGYMLPLIGPTSLPQMWGMKYASHFHYNANSNSVIMRNIGQSFGLGAMVLNDDLDTSANLYNLNRLEKLIYKIKYPEWNRHAPEELQITKAKHGDQIQRGCTIYANKCMGCHGIDSTTRVGPEKRLIHRTSFPISEIGTDPNHAIIQAVPNIVAGKPVPFNETLFGLTKAIKDRFQVLYPELTNELIKDWENRSFRGREHFRDPFFGETFDPNSNYVWLPRSGPERFTPAERADLEKYMRIEDKWKFGYSVKHLAGVWATPPYLHNGSVPNMMQLITPPGQQGDRKDIFYVGCEAYDHETLGYVSDIEGYKAGGCHLEGNGAAHSDHVFNVNDKLVHVTSKKVVPIIVNGERMHPNKPFSGTDLLGPDGAEYYEHLKLLGNGNSNAGHDYYVENLDDRKALITFLKVLQPPEEYKWQSEKMYQIVQDNNAADPAIYCTVK